MNHAQEHLEARVARLEASSAHMESDIAEIKMELRAFRQEMKAEIGGLRQDFRLLYRMQIIVLLSLIGLFLAGFMGLAGMMARGFGWL